MIQVTEKAAKKIRELLVKEGISERGGLRLGVQGGGCSGLTYAMRLDAQARDRDNVLEEDGARVFVDPKSYIYLDEVTLDYEDTLMRQGFVFQNPRATHSCGCGSSFTVLPQKQVFIPKKSDDCGARGRDPDSYSSAAESVVLRFAFVRRVRAHLWPRGATVSTSALQAGNTGSIPVGATNRSQISS